MKLEGKSCPEMVGGYLNANVFLRNWVQSNMDRRLDINTLDPLSLQTTLTINQVHDFLRNEKRRLKKIA